MMQTFLEFLEEQGWHGEVRIDLYPDGSPDIVVTQFDDDWSLN
jgi:hypothetical protein